MSAVSDVSKHSDKSNVDVVIQEKGRNSDEASIVTIRHADDALLAQLGYKSQFRREFSVRVFKVM